MKQRQTETHRRIKLMKELIRNMDRLKERLHSELVAPRLLELNMLRGLTQEQHYSRISPRLEKHASQKSALASYLCRLVKRDLESQDASKDLRIFIESGSTFAFFSAQLAEEIIGSSPFAGERKPIKILTNNFLSLTSLGVGHVEVTPGSLEASYLAFLPFHDARRKPRSLPVTDRQQHDDRRAFHSIRPLVARVDTIYLTCSDFGFLIGPLVGSRANAIFKFCLLNNEARRPIRICLDASKIRFGEGAGKLCEQNVLSTCYTALNLGHEKTGAIAQQDKLGDVRFVTTNIRDFIGPSPTEGKPRSAPTELDLREVENTGLCGGHSLNGLFNSWKSILGMYPSGRIELIISTANSSERASLVEAVAQANEFLKDGWGLQRRYSDITGADNQGVLHLAIGGLGS